MLLGRADRAPVPALEPRAHLERDRPATHPRQHPGRAAAAANAHPGLHLAAAGRCAAARRVRHDPADAGTHCACSGPLTGRVRLRQGVQLDPLVEPAYRQGSRMRVDGRACKHEPAWAIRDPMYLYVMGRGHSGSTILDILVGGSASVESLGELTSGLKHYETGGHCACGALVRECPFWDEVRRRFEAQGFDWIAFCRASRRQTSVGRWLGTRLARADHPGPPSACRARRRPLPEPWPRPRASRISLIRIRRRRAGCSCSATCPRLGSSTLCGTRAGCCAVITGG